MTNEERQKLLASLDRAANDSDWFGDYGMLCEQAADEIERLAAENKELKKTQLKFRTVERQPLTIKD